MHDAAFLEAICRNPDDDGVRLVYADYLEERGDPRGEFVRLQVQMESLPQAGNWHVDCRHHAGGDDYHCRRPFPAGATDFCTYHRMATRAWQLLSGGESAWAAALHALNRTPGEMAAFHYRRGFVERVHCTARFWQDNGPAACRLAPLREVVIQDRQPNGPMPRPAGGHQWAFCFTRPGEPLPREDWLNHWLPREFLPFCAEVEPLPVRWLKRRAIQLAWYDTEEAALAALGPMALAWARSEAFPEQRSSPCKHPTPTLTATTPAPTTSAGS